MEVPTQPRRSVSSDGCGGASGLRALQRGALDRRQESEDKAMHAAVAALEYYLPAATLSSQDLAAEFPAWWVKNIENTTGIQNRHISGPDECASDLAVAA